MSTAVYTPSTRTDHKPFHICFISSAYTMCRSYPSPKLSCKHVCHFFKRHSKHSNTFSLEGQLAIFLAFKSLCEAEALPEDVLVPRTLTWAKIGWCLFVFCLTVYTKIVFMSLDCGSLLYFFQKVMFAMKFLTVALSVCWIFGNLAQSFPFNIHPHNNQQA